ncbi:MAG: hypothetical protein IJW40_07240 [Clostridia bacterium]|nr:hypothetical protein [Clostridia bacterium]
MLELRNDLEKRLFALEVQSMDERYDAEVRMCRAWRGKNGYHSRLSECTVHPIRDAFEYAYALLNRDGEGDRARAHDLLYRVLPLQDINPSRPTYGIWQYFLEEDLEEMNPPDWNWADFNGKNILQMLAEHGDKLTDDIKMRMKDSVCHACRAIIKRDVQPNYTNISVMGAYVTLYAGEMFGMVDFFDYGKKRLQKLHQYNISHGSFSEFNSPTYTFVCLEDLSHLEADIQDAECKLLAHELSDLAWETVALHYHPASGQLAGPHDRAYAFLLADSTKLSIERALDYKIRLIEDYGVFNTQNIGAKHFSIPLRCPEKYLPYFLGNVYPEGESERIIDQTFAPGRMAYTYITDTYTLGSLHRECAWNQHRNVLGYFGTVAEPVALNLKCLHDGWDYCSGLMATIQDKGRTLTAMGFSTDGGDTHVCLDMVKNATIRARDFRIRCLLEGATKHLDAVQVGAHTFTVTDRRNGLRVTIDFPYAVFGDTPVEYATTWEGAKLGIDAIIHHGEEKELNFAALDQAMVVTLIDIAPADAPMPPAVCCEATDCGSLRATAANLSLLMPQHPAPARIIYEGTHLWRDGEEYKPSM